MAGPIVVSVIGDVRDLVKGTKSARGELSGLAKVADRAGKVIAGGLAVGAAAAVAFGAKSVKAASDSQQSVGASEAVFGKYADTVIRRSRQAAEAVGLSANEYRELNNVTGAMLASAGTPLAKVANLTDDLTKRAADLAATFGGTTREAVEAMGSLLRGEADPIERYGISIKQSDVNARLAAKGLGKLTGSARKQAEQQARLELLFKQSGKAAGQFGRESDTLAHKQQVLGAKMTDLEAKVGGLLLPALADAADFATDKVVPALEDLADWLSDNRDEFAAVADTVKGTLLPPLKIAGEVVADLAGFWSDLPGPLKAVAVEAGIAAVVFPRLAAGAVGATTAIKDQITYLRVLRLEMAETVRSQGLLSAASSRMGGTLKNVAGVGGMVALTAGATSGNKALTGLGGAITGATLGAQIGTAVFPGVGTAIGGVIGAAGGAALALSTLGKETKDASDAAGIADQDFKNLKDTLDNVTGSVTANTRQYILNKLATSGALSAANSMGVTQRDVVSAALGHADAISRVNAAMARAVTFGVTYTDQFGTTSTAFAHTRAEADRLAASIAAEGGVVSEVTRKDSLNAAGKAALRGFIRDESSAWREATAAKRKDILALQDLSGLQKTLPKKLVTKVESTGIIPTTRGIARVIRGYNLTPKQIKTIITTIGAETTVRKVQKAAASMGKAGGDAGDKYTKNAKGAVDRGSAGVQRSANSAVDKAARSAGGKARSGGASVGRDLATGTAAGINANGGIVSAAAGNMIDGALASMRVAADSHSPSRKAKKIGHDVGDGLRIGVRERRRQARAAGKALMGDLLGSMSKGSAGVNAAIDRVAARYVKAYNKSHKKDLTAKQVRALNAALDDAGRAAAKIANQYARTLTLAKDTTRAARDFASITTLTDFGVGASSGAQGIITGLEDRLAAIKAFKANLDKLAKSGLNRSSLNQLLTAGVDGGGAFAAALAAGGQDAIREVNSLQRQINQASTDLGDKIAPKVTGLDPKKVKSAAQAAAKQIANILHRRLGVRIVVSAGGTGRARVNTQRTPVAAGGSSSTGARSSAPQQFRVHFTAQQLTQIERGRQIAADLKAYRKAGGR